MTTVSSGCISAPGWNWLRRTGGIGVAVGTIVAVAVAVGARVAAGKRVPVGLGDAVGFTRTVDVVGTAGVLVGAAASEHDATKSAEIAMKASLRKEYS
jgi:hypothetical protein